MVVETFDDIAEKYFKGILNRWHITFTIATIAAICQPFVLFGVFAFLTPTHHCRQPNKNSSLTQRNIMELSIPLKNGQNQSFESCKEYNIDKVWPRIQNMSLEEAIFLRNHLYENLTVRSCTNGIQFNPLNSTFAWSVGEDFEIVCEREFYSTIVHVLYMLGMFFGFFFAGPVADNFGRRPALLFGTMSVYLLAVLVSTSINIWMFAILRFLLAMAICFVYVVGNIFLNEITTGNGRNTLMVIRCLSQDGIFIPIFALLAYLIQDWRWTHIALAYPFPIACLGYKVWIESPRWLMSQGRVEDAYQSLHSIMKISGRELNQGEINELRSDVYRVHETIFYNKEEVSDKKSKARQISDEWNRLIFLVKEPKLRFTFLKTVVLFFGMALCTYGVFFYLARTSMNTYLSTMLMGLISVPFTFLQFGLYYKFDRKWPLVGVLTVIALALIISSILKHLYNQGIVLEGFLLLSTILFKVAFNMFYVRLPELFPASHRVSVLGISGSFARIGAAIAMCVEMFGSIWKLLPILVFIIVTGICLLMSILMPHGHGEMTDEVVNDDIVNVIKEKELDDTSI